MTTLNIDQQIRELKTRLDLLENRDLDLAGRRVVNAGRATMSSDLLTLGQARELIASPESTRIIEQHITTVGGGPFGIPLSLGDTNQQGASDLFADAQHVHASGLTTKGDLLGYSTTTARVSVGTDGVGLTSLASATPGVSWTSPWKGANAKSITDAVTTGLFESALANRQMTGGTIRYLVTATDGGDHQAEAGIVTFAAVNKGGAYTTDIDKGTLSVALSAGTLAVVFSITTGASKITVNVNADTSLTATPRIDYFLSECGPVSVVTFL